VRDDGTPSGVLQDRLDEALGVWREGRVKRILVSGDHATPAYDEPNAMRTYLEAHGVPPNRHLHGSRGLDTYSSVWRARHVFGARSVIVVTQQFHLPRAVWVARSLGMEAEGRAADHHLYRAIVCSKSARSSRARRRSSTWRRTASRSTSARATRSTATGASRPASRPFLLLQHGGHRHSGMTLPSVASRR